MNLKCYKLTANAQADLQLLYTGDAYGYANLAETGNGDLLFVQIPNERALVQALQAGETGEQLALRQPRPQIVRLTAAARESVVLIDNAGQLAVALP